MDKAAREDLARLLLRLADGDRSAFDPVFARAWPVVQRFVFQALKNRADAEDVAQAALLKLFARAHLYDQTRDALGFILGIASYEVKTQRKKVARRKESHEVPALHDPADLEEETMRRELAAAVIEVLGTMSREDEEAILASMELRPRPAIAPAAFRKRVERALHRLRQTWRERHGA